MTCASWACQRPELTKPCDWDFAIASKALNNRNRHRLEVRPKSAFEGPADLHKVELKDCF
jgi:hypothetical protein